MIKLNGVEIKPTMFPDGTSQVWKIPKSSYTEYNDFFDEDVVKLENSIEWEFENEAELIHVAQLRDLLNSISNQKVNVELNIPYLPYGRQDKEVSNDNTFARRTFLGILYGLSFRRITTLDAHSSVKSWNMEDIFPEQEINVAFDTVKPSLICFPDEGAKKRYGVFFGKFPNCSFKKDRDQSTGYINNLFLNELISIDGEDVLIVDDICDGGMTFKLTAEKLLLCGANSVSLYTTHGIYSKGIQTLKNSGISRIFNRKGEVT